MRLIDADAFKCYMCRSYESVKHVYDDGGEWAKEVTAAICKDIDEQPTTDAVEVVRCGECKYGEKRHTANYLPFTYCTRQECSIKEDDYCSYGEREGE